MALLSAWEASAEPYVCWSLASLVFFWPDRSVRAVCSAPTSLVLWDELVTLVCWLAALLFAIPVEDRSAVAPACLVSSDWAVTVALVACFYSLLPDATSLFCWTPSEDSCVRDTATSSRPVFSVLTWLAP